MKINLLLISLLAFSLASCRVVDAPWTITYSDGAVYTGGYNTWSEQQGQGTMRWANGDVYTGEWNWGIQSGQGTYTWASGDVYSGEYEWGRRHGRGKLTRTDKTVYEGVWSEGELLGAKFENLPTELDAMFDTGNRTSMDWAGGPCTLPPYCGSESYNLERASTTTPSVAIESNRTPTASTTNASSNRQTPTSGATASSPAASNQRQTINYTNGGVYVGEVRDGIPHGQGTYTFANGDVYVGEYRDNQPNGQGTYTFANGSVYVGEYRDNQRNGQGTFTFANGTVQEGTWVNNQLVTTATATATAISSSRASEIVAETLNFSLDTTPKSDTELLKSSNDAAVISERQRNSNTGNQRTSSNTSTRSNQVRSSSIDRNKSLCSSYGFTPNTDGHASCVMYMSQGVSGQNQSQIGVAMREAARIQKQQNEEIIAIQLEQRRYQAEVERQRQLNASLRLMQLGLGIFTGQRPTPVTPAIPRPGNYSSFRTCNYSFGRDTATYSIPRNRICPLNWSADGMTGFLAR
jgi:hypothetical protein